MQYKPEIKTDHGPTPRADGPERRISLLVYHRDGVEVVPLLPERPVVVGRALSATVQVNDLTLSREHARFVLTDDDEVWVEDLGSTNGTSINGNKTARSVVGVADEVTLGAVSVSLHVLGQDATALRLSNHDRFLFELEQEVNRSRTFGRKVGLVMVRSLEPPARLSRWCSKVQGLLRPFDRSGVYSADELEIAVPEPTAESLAALARSIISAGGHEDRPPLGCGVGLCPDSATSAEELVSVTRRALLNTSTCNPISFAPDLSVAGISLPRHPAVPARAEDPVIRSMAMHEVMRLVDRVAASSIPVLVYGETGTGKEVLAREFHRRSSRRDQQLLCVNCGAMPGELIESTLFGHERGAFTGAAQQTKGLFEEADGGTVLLDEIGELPAGAQAALLRVLETKCITRVGSTKEIKVDVRILAATNRDLEQMCEAQTFRWDLLFRLNTMVLKIPPLRDRPEEIEPLVDRFIKQASEVNGCEVWGIEPEALSLLCRHSWPGNIRELRNVIERAVVILQRGLISANELSERIRGVAHTNDRRPTAVTGIDVVNLPEAMENDEGLFEILSGEKRTDDTAAMEAGHIDHRLLFDELTDLRSQLQHFEKLLILNMLAETDWNHALAARELGMPKRTLFHKVKEYDLRDLGPDSERPWQPVELPDSSTAGQLAFKDRVQRHEGQLIEQALRQAGGDAAEAARTLGVSRDVLAKKIKLHRLDPLSR